MKTLIIVKPSAIANKALGLIISVIEERKLNIISIKTMNFDIHSIERKSLNEPDEKFKVEMNNARKIPSVLIIAQGENAIAIGQDLKKEFKDLIHVSLNEETAKYEMNRFFEKKEIFENDLDDANYFLTGKNHEEFLHKSIEEITKEVLSEKKEKN